MVEQVRQKSELTTVNQLERWGLLSSILIWAGVLVFGVGLVVTLRNQRSERLAYASLVSSTPITGATATMTPLPTQTPQLYPVGWSTATPTPIGWSPTRVTDREAKDADKVSTNQEGVPNHTTDRSQETQVAERPAPRLALTPKPPPRAAQPPDRLVIPQIDLDSPVVPIGWYAVEQEGNQTRVWEVADYAVGWHKTSSYPGQPGNIVLNGHHNIKGEVFRYLVDLEPGDEVQLYARDQRYTFAVKEKHILKEKGEPLDVRRENARWIEPTKDERLTLITCWPYTNNTHRLVVVANPVATPSIERLPE